MASSRTEGDVICAHIPVNNNPVKSPVRGLFQSQRESRGGNISIGENEGEHGAHSGSNHTATLGDTPYSKSICPDDGVFLEQVGSHNSTGHLDFSFFALFKQRGNLPALVF